MTTARTTVLGDVLAVPDDGVDDDVAAERAGHEHLAVREVDQLQHAVDERVAEGDQRVHRSAGQSEQQIVQEFGQERTPLGWSGRSSSRGGMRERQFEMMTGRRGGPGRCGPVPPLRSSVHDVRVTG